MNNKARYNRVKDRMRSMTAAEKAETVCCRGELSVAEDEVSFRRETGDRAGHLVVASKRTMAYPSPSMLACGFDPEAVSAVAASIAEEVRLDGHNLLLGPSAAVMRSPLDGMNSRRFSEEPYLTGKMAAAFLQGLRSKGVEGCLTEFGCSHSEDDKYIADNLIDPAVLGDLYMESFRVAVSEGEAMAVRMSEGKLNGHRLWNDAATLTRLKREAGFDGAVMLPPSFDGDVRAALEAGADMAPGIGEKAASGLADSVKRGRLEGDVLDAAAMRCLAMADSLRDVPVVTGHDPEKAFNTARRAARDCMVLLKNEGGLLPLGTGKTAVIGFAAERKPQDIFRMFSTPECSGRSLLEGLEENGADVVYARGYNPDGSTNPELVREAREALRQAGRGILAVELPPGAESEGYDRRDMKLPDGILRLADFLISEELPIACVVMCGSAVEMPFGYGMKSILFTGRCGDVTGPAAADIITGKVNPSGRLSFSWPARADMTAPESRHIYSEGYATGHRAAEFGSPFEGYPFGYGLSYSGIEFLGARIDRHVIIGERQKADILFRIRNSGDRAAAFVAQVYLRRGNSKMRKLVAFRKVFVLPGQIRNEHVEIEAPRFMEFDPSSGEKVFCAGQYTLELATCCDDEGVLDTFGMSVFPKEWNTVSTAEERMEESTAHLADVSAGDDDEPQDEDDITVDDVRRTMSGRAAAAVLEEMAADAKRPFGDRWREALFRMPLKALNRLAGYPIDGKMAARAVRGAAGRRSGGFRLGK